MVRATFHAVREPPPPVRASSSDGPGLRAVVDQPGAQVFLFTTVANTDLLVMRCPLGAGACVDTASMPGSADSLFYGSVVRDPLQGDLYVANDWGAGVAVVRCNAAGANCVSLAFPAATTTLASAFDSIGLGIDNHRRRIVLMAASATDDTPLLLDCTMDLASCDVHQIAGLPPFALRQGQLSVRPGNIDVIGRRADGRLVMFRCAVPSFACADVDLSLEALRGNTMELGAIVVDEPAKAMMVVTSDPSYESRNSLFRCQLDGTKCTHTFMGTNQVPNEGTWPAAFLDREAGNLLTTFLSMDGLRRSHPALLRCGVDGKNCANVDLSQGLSGFDRDAPWTAAFDTTAKRILVLGTLGRRDSLGNSTDSAVLWRCNRDGNACAAGDLGSRMTRGVALFYDGVRNRTVMVGANAGRTPTFCDCEADGSRCSCRDMPSEIFRITAYDPQQGVLNAIGLTQNAQFKISSPPPHLTLSDETEVASASCGAMRPPQAIMGNEATTIPKNPRPAFMNGSGSKKHDRRSCPTAGLAGCVAARGPFRVPQKSQGRAHAPLHPRSEPDVGTPMDARTAGGQRAARALVECFDRSVTVTMRLDSHGMRPIKPAQSRSWRPARPSSVGDKQRDGHCPQAIFRRFTRLYCAIQIAIDVEPILHLLVAVLNEAVALGRTPAARHRRANLAGEQRPVEIGKAGAVPHGNGA